MWLKLDDQQTSEAHGVVCDDGEMGYTSPSPDDLGG